jgi:hypothetical protein
MAYDGIFLNPLEVPVVVAGELPAVCMRHPSSLARPCGAQVLFVKVKSFQIDADWVSTRMAVAYDKWSAQGVSNVIFLS